MCGVDLFALAGAGKAAAVDASAERGRVPVPVDALDVGSLRLIPARRWIWERVVEPTLAEVAHDTLPFNLHPGAVRLP